MTHTHPKMGGGLPEDQESLESLLREVVGLRQYLGLVHTYVDMLGETIEDMLTDKIRSKKDLLDKQVSDVYKHERL